ncbi:MAG: T9SS type A sorting domain-containing protein, partial [Bacteroidota bacterium]
FIVYPNPNLGRFKARVILGSLGPAEVHLFDENGNLIQLYNGPDLLAYEVDFDLTDRPSGIYPLILQTANEYRYINVVKQ